MQDGGLELRGKEICRVKSKNDGDIKRNDNGVKNGSGDTGGSCRLNQLEQIHAHKKNWLSDTHFRLEYNRKEVIVVKGCCEMPSCGGTHTCVASLA